MARNPRSRSMNTHRSSAWKTAQTAGRITEKAAVGLFRWASTDHTGFSESLRHMPSMSAGETFKYILMQFLCAVVVAVLNGVWVFVLIAFVLPFLLSGLFS